MCKIWILNEILFLNSSKILFINIDIKYLNVFIICYLPFLCPATGCKKVDDDKFWNRSAKSKNKQKIDVVCF